MLRRFAAVQIPFGKRTRQISQNSDFKFYISDSIHFKAALKLLNKLNLKFEPFPVRLQINELSDDSDGQRLAAAWFSPLRILIICLFGDSKDEKINF
jgi:hypothetical protein